MPRTPESKFAKHKFQLGNDRWTTFFQRTILHSVRSKVLQNLCFLWFLIEGSVETSLYEKLCIRLKEKEIRLTRSNLVYALELKDVMEVLQVSKRTAKEYIDALRYLIR